uniref:Uncharacterized protein n=1 Tax=Picea sitchensis TaxID=3332 RepID=D5ACC7_PICSI|nr:unknown [Picea sitchensis]
MISDRSIYQEERMCICIPLHPACDDEWTKMLIRSFRCKDKAGRRIRVMTSDALENYMDKSGICSALEKYNPATLLVPRLAEVFINLKLTLYFGVDGFSSSLVARRAMRDYLVDSTGTGFVANVFVTKALVKSNADNTNVCQVLNFTSSFLSLRSLSFMIGCVNLICSIGWGLLVAFEEDGGKWYEIHSMPPSKLRVVVIVTAIGIALGMDCLHLYLVRSHLSLRVPPMLWAVINLEIVCIVWCSTLAGFVGINVFGKWIYSAVQGLVWVKWGIGSYLLSEYSPEFDYRVSGSPLLANHYSFRWTDNGILVYSSAFLLNAILAGVRGKWDYFPATK